MNVQPNKYMDNLPTKQRILEAAKVLFWERGYVSASMAEILNKARANSGSFYHFFISKDDLLLAVLDNYLVSVEPEIIRPVQEAYADPIDRIFGMLEGYRQRLLETDCHYGCPIGRLALEIEPGNRPAQDRIAANFSAWKEAIRHFLGQAGTRLPGGVDSKSLSTFVLSVMEGAVMQARTHGQIEAFDQSVAHLRDYFRRLVSEGSSGQS